MKKLLTLLAALMLVTVALVACGEDDCEHKNVSPNPEGPNAVEATCFQEGLSAEMICDDCGAVVKESETIPKTAHPADKYVKIVAEEATCQKTGRTSGIKCGVCDETVVKFEVIPKKDHTPVNTPTVQPTATENGHEGGTHCSSCFEVLTAPTKVLPATHSLEHATEVEIPAVAPTCTTKGKTAKIICTECDGMVIQESVEIPACGHELELTAAAVSATCQSTGTTAAYKCKNCDYTEGGDTIEIDEDNHPTEFWVVVDAKAPTCYADGTLAGLWCSACNKLDEETNERIPFYAPIDTNRPAHSYKITAIAIDPICGEEKDGWTTALECSVEGCDEVVAAKQIPYEHVLEIKNPETDSEIQPNCATGTNGRTALYSCKNCDYTEGGIEVEFAHNWKTEAAVDPDCSTETNGKTEKKICQNSGCTATEGGEEIPFEHTPDEEDPTKCADCEKPISTDPAT